MNKQKVQEGNSCKDGEKEGGEQATYKEKSGTLGRKEREIVFVFVRERERNNKKAKERNQTAFENNKPTDKKL